MLMTMEWLRRFSVAAVAAIGILLVLPVPAHAQSAIAGQVTDATGAVLPGVTVEASSPALIEGARTAVTDTQGRYAIEALRPGIYKVAFTLQGFSVLIRDDIELVSNFTAPINAQLKVGAVEESLTVSGAIAARRRAAHRHAAGPDARCDSTPCRPAGTTGRSA